MGPFQKDKMLEVLRHVPLPVVIVTAAAPASAEPPTASWPRRLQRHS